MKKLEQELQEILSKYGYRTFFELFHNSNDKEIDEYLDCWISGLNGHHSTKDIIIRAEKISKIRENLKKIKQR